MTVDLVVEHRVGHRIDHLVYATPDLAAGVAHIARLLGAEAAAGGQHPGRGTRNALLGLGPRTSLTKDPMTTELWTTVDRYLTDMLVPSDAALGTAQARSATAGLPEIAVSPNHGKFLHLLAKMQGAKRILEIGTLAGSLSSFGRSRASRRPRFRRSGSRVTTVWRSSE